MIAYVKGTLTEKSPTRAVVEACGVGYEMLVPLSTYDRLPRVGEETKLLAAHCVREDDETLFGFATEDEREMFGKLTGVSGVGPKIAVAILSGASVSELASAISRGDAKRLSAIKGVGKKTAEKICIELRDKVAALALSGAIGETKSSPLLKDAVVALRALGFSEETSSKMVADVVAKNPNVDDLGKVVKLALTANASTIPSHLSRG